MQLISVNIGSKRTQPKGNEMETTGIYKLPARGPVPVAALGIQDDFICDTQSHGGPDQAIYVYGAADYAWWSKELGRELEPGTFGDNLTISDLESAGFNIGDRLHIGTVTLEVTAPRHPCSTLAARMGDPQFVKQFRRVERPGLYCRVIREGTLTAGDEVKVESHRGETVSILQMFREHYERHKTEASLRRHLDAPISIRARRDLEEELQKLLTGGQGRP